MVQAGIALLWAARILCGLIVLLQIFGLLPVFTWLSNPAAVTTGMWMMVVVKLVILAIASAGYWGLGKAIHRLKAKQNPDATAVQSD